MIKIAVKIALLATLDQEANSALYQSLLSGVDPFPIDNPSTARLLVAFDRLNDDGQMEAIRRTEELAQIPAFVSKGRSTIRAARCRTVTLLSFFRESSVISCVSDTLYQGSGQGVCADPEQDLQSASA